MAKVYAKEKIYIYKITGGSMKGKKFEMEGDIKSICGESCLATLASKGNIAAKNALRYENYTIEDAPFYYGKIKGGGFIFSHKHLKKIEDE